MPQSAARPRKLRLLRLLERLRPTREDRARVGHRAIEEQLEELVRDVVMVAYRAGVATERVPPTPQDQLRRGPPWRTDQTHRPDTGGHQPHTTPDIDLRRLPLVHKPHRSVEVVDIENAADVRPADPKLARGPQHMRDRAWRPDQKSRTVAATRRHPCAVPQHQVEGPLRQRFCGRRLNTGPPAPVENWTTWR